MKFTGSKQRISKYIVPIIQECIDDNKLSTFLDCFVGGANIIDKIKCENRVGNDKNHYLIALWNALKEGFYLQGVEMNEDIYKDIRENPSKYPDEIVAVAGILASYNSKWFAGYAKPHYVSEKCTRHYYEESIKNVESQLPNIQDITFISKDYKDLNIPLTPPIMIYCDPPYANKVGFKDKIDHSEYWEWVRKISMNHYVLCSEYVAPDDFKEVWSGQVRITLDNASRSNATEKLFTYKGGLYDKYIAEKG